MKEIMIWYLFVLYDLFMLCTAAYSCLKALMRTYMHALIMPKWSRNSNKQICFLKLDKRFHQLYITPWSLGTTAVFYGHIRDGVAVYWNMLMNYLVLKSVWQDSYSERDRYIFSSCGEIVCVFPSKQHYFAVPSGRSQVSWRAVFEYWDIFNSRNSNNLMLLPIDYYVAEFKIQRKHCLICLLWFPHTPPRYF